MKTLPIRLLEDLGSSATADRKAKVEKAGWDPAVAAKATGTASVTYHRNQVKRTLTVVTDAQGVRSVGYEFLNKKTGLRVTRKDIVKGGNEFLRVERWRTDNDRWGATLLYWDWSNIRQLEQEMLLAYTLAMEDK